MTHLVISGTGRCGTSFMVRWLAEAGLDVGEFTSADWHDTARAGWERRVASDGPYVMKDPWLFTYLDGVDPAWIDHLVIPVRKLEDAAASRLAVENRRIAETNPAWSAAQYGDTPGGLIYSLHSVDLERLLAVGFHTLVQWAVAHDVPFTILDYPRLVQDEGYAVRRLAVVTGVDPNVLGVAHARTRR